MHLLQVTFAGYDALTTESEIKVIATEDKLVDKLTQGQEGTVIVPVTTFYATMGGQKGDKGQIKTENGVFAVTDTVKLPGGRIGHIGSVVSGSIMAGEKASMEVDACITCKHMQKPFRNTLITGGTSGGAGRSGTSAGLLSGQRAHQI